MINVIIIQHYCFYWVLDILWYLHCIVEPYYIDLNSLFKSQNCIFLLILQIHTANAGCSLEHLCANKFRNITDIVFYKELSNKVWSIIKEINITDIVFYKELSKKVWSIIKEIKNKKKSWIFDTYNLLIPKFDLSLVDCGS